jgi:cobalamin biosynthesis protein CbiD
VRATAIWAEHDPACKTVIVAVSLIEQISGVVVEYVRVPVPSRVVAVEIRVAVGEYVTEFELAKVNDIT